MNNNQYYKESHTIKDPNCNKTYFTDTKYFALLNPALRVLGLKKYRVEVLGNY